jgi:hypothetical protein
LLSAGGHCRQAKYGGGSGTEAEPYRISSVADWQELMATPADWGSHFVLTADIDVNDVSITPIAPDASSDSGFQGTKFTGVFDGNDCVIRNADVNMPGTDYVGLFGYLRWRGQIKNLAIEDASIFGKSYVGGLVGYNYDGAVSNCYLTGSVSGADYVGGVVGVNGSGAISNCYSSGSVSGHEKVGGLVGKNGDYQCHWYCDELGNCWEECREYSGYICKSHSTGKVSGGSSVGGLVGAHEAGEVGDSCWDIETSDCNTSAGGTPKTTAEMMTQSTFTSAGWDFIGETANGTEDIWAICEGTNYPRFVYQIPQGDIVCPDGVNSLDFSILARYWHETDCAALDDCEGADIDLSGAVDFGDVAAVAEAWLRDVR